MRGTLAAARDAPAIRPAASIPALAKREDQDRSEGQEEGERPGRSAALDPRGPSSILSEHSSVAEHSSAAARDDREKASKRLDELLGQKADLERRQADQKARSAQAVASELTQLKARDTHVRAHEAAHIAAGGRYVTGGASYTYEKGPDGAEYAIGGEVGIDTSPVPGKPEETVEKMRVIRAAALAPSDPSAADISVAASASEIEAEALAQIAQSRAEEFAGRYASAADGSQDMGRASGGGGPDSRRRVDMVA